MRAVVIPGPADPAASPAVLLGQLQELIGAEAVARWCAGLLAGSVRYDDPQMPPLGWLGSGAANELQRGDLEPRGQDYWVRTWAARGLLHGWHEAAADVAVPAIVGALHDDAWRVREMAAKVVRRWQITDAAADLALLENDDVPRVRAAAERAGAALGNAGSSRIRAPVSRTTSHRTPKPQAAGAGPRISVTVEDLESALADAVQVLRRGVDLDWSVPAGTLSWDCRRTCAHIADDLIAYAAQLAAQVPRGYLPFRLQPSRDTPPEGLVNLV